MSLLSHANVLAQSNQPIPRRANRLQHTRILPIATDPPRHTLGTQNLARPREFEPLTSAEGELAPSAKARRRRCRDASRPLSRRNAPVAQLDRALPSEGRGQRFESSRARHDFNSLTKRRQLTRLLGKLWVSRR